MAPRWPNGAPSGAQESLKAAPIAPKSAPRAPQETMVGAPEGQPELGNPSSLIDVLQDGPK
eukprot:2098777-Pyramimonas_sp.AAC.1